MTMRLSTSSFAGTARTLVAVGTPRLVSMLVTTRAAAPLMRTCSGAAGSAAGAGRSLAGASLRGVGEPVVVVLVPPTATGGVPVFSGVPVAAVVGADGAGTVESLSAGVSSRAPADDSEGFSRVGLGAAGGAAAEVSLPTASVATASLRATRLSSSGVKSAKNSHQAGSTDSLSSWYCW